MTKQGSNRTCQLVAQLFGHLQFSDDRLMLSLAMLYILTAWARVRLLLHWTGRRWCHLAPGLLHRASLFSKERGSHINMSRLCIGCSGRRVRNLVPIRIETLEQAFVTAVLLVGRVQGVQTNSLAAIWVPVGWEVKHVSRRV